MMLNRKMFTHITKTFLMPHRCQFVAGKVPVKRPKPLRNPPTKKDDLDYTKLSEEQKKVIRDTYNMYTPAHATQDLENLKRLIIKYRNLLNESIRNDAYAAHNLNYNDLPPKELKYRYYIVKSLDILAWYGIRLFLANAAGICILFFTDHLEMLGWFLSCVTESSTAFFTAFLIGANMSYWLMQHALVIHLPINKIRTTIIKNQETSWNQWGSLTLIALQYFGLISCYCFDTGLPLHYCLGGLMGISLLKINDDLKRILYYADVYYWPKREYLKLLASCCCLFALLSGLILNINNEDRYDFKYLRARIKTGYQRSKYYFKTPQFKIIFEERINDE